MNHTGVKITGVGHYAPPAVLTNEDLEKVLDTSDEWITTRTGMKRRHIASAADATSDLAIVAARKALAQASLTPQDIDCYMVATVTPDFVFPATACILASKLGATDKAAFDLEIACSGFIYGLTVASGLIRSGVYKRIMLVGAETLSKIVDRNDRATAVLFGDGAGAVVLEASNSTDSFLSSELGTDGSRPEVLRVAAGGSRHPLTPAAWEAGEQYIQMEGREVFKFAVTKMIDATDVALRKAQLKKSDLDWLIPHQANKRIIDASAKKLGIAEEKVVITVNLHGNTSAASVPLALAIAAADGRIKRGDLVLLEAMGGGFTWGAVLVRW